MRSKFKIQKYPPEADPPWAEKVKMKNLIRQLVDRIHISSFINHTSGFTLVELLVVIGVIGALATTIITIINPATQTQRANDARRKSDLAQIQKALELFYNDNGRYPPHSSDYEICPTTASCGATGIVWGASSGWANYMKVIPKDSTSVNTYVYVASSNGQSYKILATMYKLSDSAGPCGSGPRCSNAPNPPCTTATSCNYGVSSANTDPMQSL